MDDRSGFQIRPDMDVLASNDEKVGDVDRLEGDYIVVKKGFFFPTDYYIPTSAIASIGEDRLYLTETKETMRDQGWDTAPPAGAVRGGTLSNDTSPQPHIGMSYDDERAAGIDTAAIPEEHLADHNHDHNHQEERVERDLPFPHYADHAQSHIDDTGSDTIRVPLTEEELTATRRSVDRGAVRVEKDVVEEDRSLDVPVIEEEVHVARRRVDCDVEPEETAFEQETLEVPVRGEEVDVRKRACVTEEVDVAKKPVERTQHVTGKVRREEAHVEDASGTVADDDLGTADMVDDGTRTQRDR